MRLSQCLLLTLASFLASAETVYQGTVVRIVDGDTLVLLVDQQQLKIRLADIDTPESTFRYSSQRERRSGIWKREIQG